MWALCIKGRWGNLPLRPLLSAIHRLPFFFLYDFLVLHLKTLPLLSSLGTPPYVLDGCHRFMNHPIKPTRALKFIWLKRLLKKQRPGCHMIPPVLSRGPFYPRGCTMRVRVCLRISQTGMSSAQFCLLYVPVMGWLQETWKYKSTSGTLLSNQAIHGYFRRIK